VCFSPLFHFSHSPITLLPCLGDPKRIRKLTVTPGSGSWPREKLFPLLAPSPAPGTPYSPRSPPGSGSSLEWSKVKVAVQPQSTSWRRKLKACSIKLHVIHLLVLKELFYGQCLVIAFSYSSLFGHKMQYFVRIEVWKQNLEENCFVRTVQALATFRFFGNDAFIADSYETEVSKCVGLLWCKTMTFFSLESLV